jgi:hypothetical protein
MAEPGARDRRWQLPAILPFDIALRPVKPLPFQYAYILRLEPVVR